MKEILYIITVILYLLSLLSVMAISLATLFMDIDQNNAFKLSVVAYMVYNELDKSRVRQRAKLNWDKK